MASFIGTAGWSIPSRYKDELPEGGSHLERYAKRLNAVEINTSFYRHHRAETYARWAAAVPEDFRFSVKTPQTLTVKGELTPQREVLDRFVDEVRALGSKLGALLIQFPPKLAFDESQASELFSEIQKKIAAPLVCEPRHATWSSQDAERFLTERKIARVAADPPLWPGGDEPAGFNETAYFRWHGQPRKYYSDYEPEQLVSLQQRVKRAQEHARDVWIIFDNTASGCALGNALTFRAANI